MKDLSEIQDRFRKMDDTYEFFVEEYFKFERKPTRLNKEKVIKKLKLFRRLNNALDKELKNLFIPEEKEKRDE